VTERALAPPRPTTGAWRRLAFLLPVAIFGLVAVGLGLMRNPQDIPSVLVADAVPEFSLPPVQGRTPGLASTQIARLRQ
jgi:cytochrome c biogenesis protein CcmG/thiol:disulfide interchange protein DsbE